MKYQTVEDVLPENLILEIQKYIDGEFLYIPVRSKKSWGSKSGIKTQLKERNIMMKKDFANGTSIEELAEKYFLSESTIKNIVYRK